MLSAIVDLNVRAVRPRCRGAPPAAVNRRRRPRQHSRISPRASTVAHVPSTRKLLQGARDTPLESLRPGFAMNRIFEGLASRQAEAIQILSGSRTAWIQFSLR